jgi:hypothetical protein
MNRAFGRGKNGLVVKLRKGETMAEPTKTPATAPAAPWWVALIDLLEEIWNALPASKSEPNHPVAVKLAALKASVPPGGEK